MSKPRSKKAFMEKLQFYTSLYFCDEEAAGIQSDYESWFEAEVLQGKKDEDICAGFGEPKRIIQNLLAESGLPNGISLFFHNRFLQILFLTAAHFFLNLFFCISAIKTDGITHSLPWGQIFCISLPEVFCSKEPGKADPCETICRRLFWRSFFSYWSCFFFQGLPALTPDHSAALALP